MVFALELKLSKTLRWLVYFDCSYRGGFAPRISTRQNTQAPLRVDDHFNSEAKTIATINFCKMKSAKLKVARFLPKEI